ncbi:MAG: hypothetical protein Q8O57_04535, partial [Kiritimatiellota bacterium]|nr:hypothetical protein [Kiritimatiellota bacterium]
NAGEHLNAAAEIDASRKMVVIIGGGDTGADCLGTAIRQGAKSVLQLEILPEPPQARPATTPWPMWPSIRRDSTSHMEGGFRRWGVSTMKFHGQNDRVTALDCVEVDSRCQPNGRVEFIPRQGTGFELEAEMVLLALGYVATSWDRIADNLHLERDPPAIPTLREVGIALRAGRQASVKTDEDHMTSIPGVFVAGDMRRGPSLVAWAIADGIAAARGIMRWLKKACITESSLVYSNPIWQRCLDIPGFCGVKPWNWL